MSDPLNDYDPIGPPEPETPEEERRRVYGRAAERLSKAYGSAPVPTEVTAPSVVTHFAQNMFSTDSKRSVDGKLYLLDRRQPVPDDFRVVLDDHMRGAHGMWVLIRTGGLLCPTCGRVGPPRELCPCKRAAAECCDLPEAHGADAAQERWERGAARQHKRTMAGVRAYADAHPAEFDGPRDEREDVELIFSHLWTATSKLLQARETWAALQESIGRTQAPITDMEAHRLESNIQWGLDEVTKARSAREAWGRNREAKLNANGTDGNGFHEIGPRW